MEPEKTPQPKRSDGPDPFITKAERPDLQGVRSGCRFTDVLDFGRGRKLVRGWASRCQPLCCVFTQAIGIPPFPDGQTYDQVFSRHPMASTVIGSGD
jgi:hypothetical protein